MRRVLFSCLIPLLLSAPAAAAQTTGTITGSVTGDAGQPLQGANIRAGNLTALTNTEGRFTISGVQPGQHEVRANMLGYGEGVQSVTVAAGQTATVNFALVSEALELEGIVAVGYGTQRRESLTGSVATVTADELAEIPAATSAPPIAPADVPATRSNR